MARTDGLFRRAHPVLHWTLLLGVAFLLLAFVVSPFKKRPVGPGVELADLIDFAVSTPLFALLFYKMYRALAPDGPQPAPLRLLALSSFALFFAGGGAHFAANDIHNLMDRSGITSGPVFDLAYFHDEVLGHKLTYAGLAGLFATGVWLQFLRPQPLDPRDTRAAWLLAPFLGAGLGFIVVEGQSAVEGLVLAAVSAPVVWRRKGRAGGPWSRWPFALVVFGASVAMALFLVVWSVRFGGFPEPSKLWGI